MMEVLKNQALRPAEGAVLPAPERRQPEQRRSLNQ